MVIRSENRDKWEQEFHTVSCSKNASIFFTSILFGQKPRGSDKNNIQGSNCKQAYFLRRNLYKNHYNINAIELHVWGLEQSQHTRKSLTFFSDQAALISRWSYQCNSRTIWNYYKDLKWLIQHISDGLNHSGLHESWW